MSVVAGLDKFRESMGGLQDRLALIGGGACSLLFSGYGREFRITHDLDLVVLADGADPELARALWRFVCEGGYTCGSRNNTKARYYRFTLDAAESVATGYPQEIELFARHPGFDLAPGSWLAPLPSGDDDVRSLSAIVLDDDYYAFLCDGLTKVGGVRIPDLLHIIPLKMRAHIDNNELHDSGVHIAQKNLRKHRSDILRLTELLPSDASLPLEGRLRDDARTLFDDLETFAKHQVARKREEVLEAASFLRGVYC